MMDMHHHTQLFHWPRPAVLLISASQAARMTGVSHQCLDLLPLNVRLFGTVTTTMSQLYKEHVLIKKIAKKI
jgi:hypothetical protein